MFVLHKLCYANYWLGHLSFIGIVVLFVKSFRVYFIVNSKQLKRVKFTTLHAVYLVLGLSRRRHSVGGSPPIPSGMRTRSQLDPNREAIRTFFHEKVHLCSEENEGAEERATVIDRVNIVLEMFNFYNLHKHRDDLLSIRIPRTAENEMIDYLDTVIGFITENKKLDPTTLFECDTTTTGDRVTFERSTTPLETIQNVKLYKGAGNAQDNTLVQGVYCDSFTAYNPGTNFPVLREARSISEFKCSVRTIDTDYLNEVHCITKQIGKFSNETPAKQYDLYTQRMILAILLFKNYKDSFLGQSPRNKPLKFLSQTKKIAKLS